VASRAGIGASGAMILNVMRATAGRSHGFGSQICAGANVGVSALVNHARTRIFDATTQHIGPRFSEPRRLQWSTVPSPSSTILPNKGALYSAPRACGLRSRSRSHPTACRVACGTRDAQPPTRQPPRRRCRRRGPRERSSDLCRDAIGRDAGITTVRAGHIDDRVDLGVRKGDSRPPRPEPRTPRRWPRAPRRARCPLRLGHDCT